MTAATWSVRLDRLRTRLRVGLGDDERLPQPVWVSLRLHGSAPAHPASLSDCIDYLPLCRWIREHWPTTPHTALLETRVNQLMAAAFGLDPRIHDVHVGLAKQHMGRDAVSVGIERSVTRAEFDAQRLALDPAERSADDRLAA